MDGPAWRLFERVAAEYDQVVPFFTGYGEAIVAALDPQPGCRFLDLGAGRGALTAPALDRGCAVTAVDAAPSMVGRIAETYPAARTCVMDAEALAFAAGSFDLVAASFVIHLLDRPPAGVAEAYRVLAHGGRFAFTGSSARQAMESQAASAGSSARQATESQAASASTRSDASAQAMSLGGRFNALFAEFADYLPPGASMGRSVDAADLLTEAGFVDLRVDRAEVAVRFADNEILWRWAMSHGYRAFIEDLPTDRRRQFRERVLALPADDRILTRTTGVWSGRKP